MKKSAYIIAFLGIFLSYLSFSYAIADVISPTQILPEINNASEPGDAIGAIIAWLIRITGILSIIAITWASIQMVLAAGDEEKAKKARYIIIYAFMGLVIAGLSYGVVQFVTNVNLNNFL